MKFCLLLAGIAGLTYATSSGKLGYSGDDNGLWDIAGFAPRYLDRIGTKSKKVSSFSGKGSVDSKAEYSRLDAFGTKGTDRSLSYKYGNKRTGVPYGDRGLLSRNGRGNGKSDDSNQSSAIEEKYQESNGDDEKSNDFSGERSSVRNRSDSSRQRNRDGSRANRIQSRISTRSGESRRRSIVRDEAVGSAEEESQSKASSELSGDLEVSEVTSKNPAVVVGVDRKRQQISYGGYLQGRQGAQRNRQGRISFDSGKRSGVKKPADDDSVIVTKIVTRKVGKSRDRSDSVKSRQSNRRRVVEEEPIRIHGRGHGHNWRGYSDKKASITILNNPAVVTTNTTVTTGDVTISSNVTTPATIVDTSDNSTTTNSTDTTVTDATTTTDTTTTDTTTVPDTTTNTADATTTTDQNTTTTTADNSTVTADTTTTTDTTAATTDTTTTDTTTADATTTDTTGTTTTDTTTNDTSTATSTTDTATATTDNTTTTDTTTTTNTDTTATNSTAASDTNSTTTDTVATTDTTDTTTVPTTTDNSTTAVVDVPTTTDTTNTTTVGDTPNTTDATNATTTTNDTTIDSGTPTNQTDTNTTTTVTGSTTTNATVVNATKTKGKCGIVRGYTSKTTRGSLPRHTIRKNTLVGGHYQYTKPVTKVQKLCRCECGTDGRHHHH